MEPEVKESRKETLLKAWESTQEGDDEHKAVGTNPAATEEHAGDESEAAKHAEAADEENKAPEKSEKGKEAVKEESPDKKEARAAAELERKPSPAVNDRAPNSWKPATREHWARLPPEVRAEVSRRELEIQQELSKTAQVRRFAQDFAQVINPYSHLIRAQNSTPLQAVNNLMQTAAGLMQGNQQQKAQIVAEIIANYGIDVQTLDKVLSGGAYNPQNVQQPQNQPVPQWAQPIFGFMDNLQRMQEQRQMQLQQEAEQAVQSVADKPFFEDVREEMADLMEAAAKRGRTLTMEQAYERAIALNPELNKIVEQRKLAERNRNPVSEAAATLARARKAASTIKGAPQGPKAGAPNGKMSRRQQLLEAWDEQQS